MSKAALKFLLVRGKDLPTLLDVQASGVEVKTLENRPDKVLSPELQMMLTHFVSLSRQRRFDGFSGVPSAIPLTEIEAYYRIQDVGDYMAMPEFAEWMIVLDSEFIDHYSREAEQKSKKT